MNLLDGLILLLLIGGLFSGYKKGLIKGTVSLIGMLAAVVVAWKLSPDLGPALMEIIPLPETVSDSSLPLFFLEKPIYMALAFVLLFLVTRLLFSIVANILTAVADLPVLAQINGLGGALVGFLKALLLIFVAVNLLHILPWDTGQEAVTGSSISRGILQLTPDFSGESVHTTRS